MAVSSLACAAVLLCVASMPLAFAALSPTFATELSNIQYGLSQVAELNLTYSYLNQTGYINILANQTAATFLCPNSSAYPLLPASVKALLSGPNRNTVLTNIFKFLTIPQYRDSSLFQMTSANTQLPTLLGGNTTIFFIPVGGQNFFFTNESTPRSNSTDIGPDVVDDQVISVQEIDRILLPPDLSLLLPASPPASPPSVAPSSPPTTTPAAPPPSSTPATTPPPSTTSAAPAPAPAPTSGAYVAAALDMRVLVLAGVFALTALLL